LCGKRVVLRMGKKSVSLSQGQFEKKKGAKISNKSEPIVAVNSRHRRVEKKKGANVVGGGIRG